MTTLGQRVPWIAAACAGILVFIAFTIWGGIPTEASLAIFCLQASLFFLVLCAFVLAFWHLLVRPLAPNLRQPQYAALTVRARELFALALASGGVAIFIGGVWDELWHRNYGIPFGEDLFWRPHLLMYFGFATAIGAGFWALLHLNRHLRGNFQQRFRANPLVGLMILNAAFLLYALPADPLWHWIFGEDITAWSIPHLILLTSFVLTQMLALALHASTLPRQGWRLVSRLALRDGLALVILAAIQLIWLQIMLIDWDAMRAGLSAEWIGQYRPEWLLAANLLACVTFTGVLATRHLRCAGAATAAGLLALVIRIGLIQLFDAEKLQFVAWLAALLPLLAIDIWAFYCAKIRAREPDWRGTAVAVIVGMAINLPVIQSLYGFESIDALASLAAIIATGLGMSWLATQAAEATPRQREGSDASAAASQPIKPAVSVAMAAAFLVFIFVFVTTASPPA